MGSIVVDTPKDWVPTGIPTDVPTPARMYDYVLGGKDNFAIDRDAVQTMMARFPESLDAVRGNRLFLYRVVRFLARDVGIRQFLDMGSGLPTLTNVHQVAQEFQPDAHVVYVDNDPIVLAHSRAMLAGDESTAVVTADMSEPAVILAHPRVRELIDFSQPVAVLFLSVMHSIVDDATVHSMLATVVDAIVPGSYLALSQGVGLDQAAADESNEMGKKLGLTWKNRTPPAVVEFVRGLEPVEPGLGDVLDWRPDPTQPPLGPVHGPLRKYIGGGRGDKRFIEFGGVLRKP